MAAELQQHATVPGVKTGPFEAQGTGGAAVGKDLPEQRLTGSISGTIVDPTGAPIPSARVKLSHEDQSPDQEVLSGDDGEFSFANVAPGPFGITFTSEGFAAQASSGILLPGESYTVPKLTMALATAVTEVRVVVSRAEVAADEMQCVEKH